MICCCERRTRKLATTKNGVIRSTAEWDPKPVSITTNDGGKVKMKVMEEDAVEMSSVYSFSGVPRFLELTIL